MRKVELRMNELEKYEVIKKLVDSNGNKKTAAIRLNCSTRTINRLIILYKEKGKEGFIHGNRNRKPATSFSKDVKDHIIHLYLSKYKGANIKHFCELLLTNENISVSDSTVRNWLYKEDVLSPKATRKMKKKKKQEIKNRLSSTKTKKEKVSLEDKLETIDRFNAHPRRPRCAYKGELIQMDASPHLWFGNAVTHLHLAIDDATGEIVGAFFDHEETLFGYYNVLSQILKNHGIPVKFLTDRRSVFEYKRKNASSDEEDTFTQFSYACHQLGIQLECSSVPQAKGRIERLNQTLQSRLTIELRLAGIKTIEEANEFLNHYIKEFNEQFSLPINSTKNAFEKQPEDEKINLILSVLSERKIDSGHCLRFENKYYIPIDKNGNQQCFKKGSTAMVIKAFDGSMYVNVLDRIFALKEIEVRRELSSNFDIEEKQRHKTYYIPPLTHPWKQDSFFKYVTMQKHRQEEKRYFY